MRNQIRVKKTTTEGSDQWCVISTNNEHQLSLTRKQAIELITLLSDVLWGKKRGE